MLFKNLHLRNLVLSLIFLSFSCSNGAKKLETEQISSNTGKGNRTALDSQAIEDAQPLNQDVESEADLEDRPAEVPSVISGSYLTCSGASDISEFTCSPNYQEDFEQNAYFYVEVFAVQLSGSKRTQLFTGQVQNMSQFMFALAHNIKKETKSLVIRITTDGLQQEFNMEMMATTQALAPASAGVDEEFIKQPEVGASETAVAKSSSASASASASASSQGQSQSQSQDVDSQEATAPVTGEVEERLFAQDIPVLLGNGQLPRTRTPCKALIAAAGQPFGQNYTLDISVKTSSVVESFTIESLCGIDYSYNEIVILDSNKTLVKRYKLVRGQTSMPLQDIKLEEGDYTFAIRTFGYHERDQMLGLDNYTFSGLKFKFLGSVDFGFPFTE